MIIWVSVVLRRTVCYDNDRRFDNLSGIHHQSQVNLDSFGFQDHFTNMVDTKTFLDTKQFYPMGLFIMLFMLILNVIIQIKATEVHHLAQPP